jgi:hypothetical protein
MLLLLVFLVSPLIWPSQCSVEGLALSKGVQGGGSVFGGEADACSLAPNHSAHRRKISIA